MGRIMEALHRLNELDSTSNKQKEFKYKLHFPGYELTDENELDDEGNPINVNDDPNEEPIYKKKRAAAGYIYVLTQADPISLDPDMRLCKIGYARDTEVRLSNFNGETGNSSPRIDWYARVPIYYGHWDQTANKGEGAFVPYAGKTDQLDKRMHDIIDTIVDTAQEHMNNNRGSNQDIDLRIKNDNTGRYKEWYRMSPKDAVRILNAVLKATAPTSMYGKIEMNTEHKYYDPDIMTKSYDRYGNQRSQRINTAGVDRTGTSRARRINVQAGDWILTYNSTTIKAFHAGIFNRVLHCGAEHGAHGYRLWINLVSPNLQAALDVASKMGKPVSAEYIQRVEKSKEKNIFISSLTPEQVIEIFKTIDPNLPPIVDTFVKQESDWEVETSEEAAQKIADFKARHNV